MVISAAALEPRDTHVIFTGFVKCRARSSSWFDTPLTEALDRALRMIGRRPQDVKLREFPDQHDFGVMSARAGEREFPLFFVFGDVTRAEDITLPDLNAALAALKGTA